MGAAHGFSQFPRSGLCTDTPWHELDHLDRRQAGGEGRWLSRTWMGDGMWNRKRGAALTLLKGRGFQPICKFTHSYLRAVACHHPKDQPAQKTTAATRAPTIEFIQTFFSSKCCPLVAI